MGLAAMPANPVVATSPAAQRPPAASPGALAAMAASRQAVQIQPAVTAAASLVSHPVPTMQQIPQRRILARCRWSSTSLAWGTSTAATGVDAQKAADDPW
ncbi:MAG TPA: hypothetical protein VHX39_09900 [Acetobacteraceae bacterium]|nr:hypothetical protein [Acetobacteraceae bacterium]